MSEILGERYYTDYEDPILPSQVTSHVWLQMDNPNAPERLIDKDYETLTGKWLLYPTPEKIDALWPVLKRSLQAGRLGVSMKASTPLTGVREGAGLICIYTKSWQDIADIRRVLSELRKLGISDRIYYKADAQTLLGMSGSVYGSRQGTELEITPKGREWYREMDTPIPTSL
jgi:hypothetical protein